MKNANSTAPRAAPYSAPCCSRESRTAPRAVRIGDYSAPCCSEATFQTPRTAPRAVLISITKRSAFYFAPLHRFQLLLHRSPRFPLTLCALPALRRLHPSHVSQIAPFARAVTVDTTSQVTTEAQGCTGQAVERLEAGQARLHARCWEEEAGSAKDQE